MRRAGQVRAQLIALQLIDIHMAGAGQVERKLLDLQLAHIHVACPGDFNVQRVTRPIPTLYLPGARQGQPLQLFQCDRKDHLISVIPIEPAPAGGAGIQVEGAVLLMNFYVLHDLVGGGDGQCLLLTLGQQHLTRAAQVDVCDIFQRKGPGVFVVDTGQQRLPQQQQ